MKIGDVTVSYNNEAETLTKKEQTEFSNKIGYELMKHFSSQVNNFGKEFTLNDIIQLYVNVGIYYMTHAIRNFATFSINDQYRIAEEVFNVVLNNLEGMTLEDQKKSRH